MDNRDVFFVAWMFFLTLIALALIEFQTSSLDDRVSELEASLHVRETTDGN